MVEAPRDTEELLNLIREHGINVRYLGRFATEIEHNHLRELATREIIARSIKVLVRDGLSFLRDEPNGFTKEDIKKCVIHYLNEIFTRDNRESSIKVWEFLTETIRKKFDVFIEKDIIEKINVRALVYSVAKYLNLIYNPEYNPMNLDNSYPFNIDDLIDV